MAQYATKIEAAAFSAELAALDDDQQDPLLVACSRMIDRLCEVPADFFQVAGAAAARTFYGDGTAFLRVDAYDPGTAPTVVMETGYDEPTWIEQGEPGAQFLVVNSQVKEQDVSQYGGADSRYVGWHNRVSVAVTAKWGYPSAVPDEVRQATLDLAIHTWRKADPARLALEGGTPAILNREIPPVVQMITDELRGRLSRKAAFA